MGKWGIRNAEERSWDEGLSSAQIERCQCKSNKHAQNILRQLHCWQAFVLFHVSDNVRTFNPNKLALAFLYKQANTGSDWHFVVISNTSIYSKHACWRRMIEWQLTDLHMICMKTVFFPTFANRLHYIVMH